MGEGVNTGMTDGDEVYDLFVSYAHADDEAPKAPLRAGSARWRPVAEGVAP